MSSFNYLNWTLGKRTKPNAAHICWLIFSFFFLGTSPPHAPQILLVAAAQCGSDSVKGAQPVSTFYVNASASEWDPRGRERSVNGGGGELPSRIRALTRRRCGSLCLVFASFRRKAAFGCERAVMSRALDSATTASE